MSKGPLAIIGTAFGFVALLMAISSMTGLIYGTETIQSAFVPGWIGFATANPQLFAFILVVGTALFGTGFVNFMGEA